MELTKRFVVVSVHQSAPSRQKDDKQMTAKVAQDTGADSKAHKVKRLLYPPDVLDPWDKSCNALRTEVKTITTPWLSDGEYLLSVGAMLDLQEMVNKKRAEAERVADAIAAQFDVPGGGIIERCKVFRNGGFNQSDYPSDQTEFRRKFKLEVEFRPVEDIKHVLIEAAEDEIRIVTESTARQVNSKVAEAEADLTEKITESVQKLIDRLAAKDKDKGSPLHASAIENVAHIAKYLPHLNITGSALLDGLRDDLTAIGNTPVEVLKVNQSARTAAAEKAANVLAKLNAGRK